MKTKDLITEAISLPIEERTIVVDSILKSINQPEAQIDKIWTKTAKQRLHDLRSGKIKSIFVSLIAARGILSA